MDFASVPFQVAPSKSELRRRLKRGEILRNSDAVLAADMGLGSLVRLMPSMELVLRPNGVRRLNVRRLNR